jgi:predicted RNA-binding protein with PUA-like domain
MANLTKNTSRRWLMKTEPDVYSIADLKRDGTTCWDCIRNYQARNFMRDDMQVGDLVLIHHSNGDPPGIAGVARVCKAAYPDHTQFDPKHEYFDPKSKRDNPQWMMVDVEFVSAFDRLVTLPELRAVKTLAGMALLQKGQRLSIMPVTVAEFEAVLKLAGVSGKMGS